jgi:tetratricopeptide (TPR) repeat protein
MKNKKYTILLILFVGNFSFSQGRFNTYQSDLKYTARSYDELARLPQEMKRKHDNNLEYLYSIQEWIIELKSEIKDDYYLEGLNKIYEFLDNEKKRGLANSYSELKEVELFIKDKIVNEYNKEIEKKSNINNSYEKALKDIEGENYESAYKTLNYILEEDPNNIRALFQRGKINLYIKNNYDLAIEDFKKLIDIKPEITEGYLLRGEAFYEKGDFYQAINDYSKFLSSNPNDTDVLFMRALAKSGEGNKYYPIEDYDMIIKLENTAKPRNYKMSTVYNNKAYCLVGLENYTDALPLVNKALELDKSEAYIWDTRGEIYYKLKQYQKCVSDMNNAILIKESANSYYYRGLAQLKLGKKTLGCKDLSKASDLGKEEATKSLREGVCN